jgi:hypothetical protein
MIESSSYSYQEVIPINPIMTSANAAEERQEREANGQCPSCGQQLYQFKHSIESQKSWSLSRGAEDSQKGSEKIPLSIPQLVLRGQCLVCTQDSPSSLKAQSAPGSQELAPLLQSHPAAHHASFSGELAAHHASFSGDLPVCTAVYEGPYNEYGEKHGPGEMVWSNADVYKGSFVRDAREGQGTLTFAQDGGEYVGDWLNNQMHGSGTRRYPNGDVYTGEYDTGKRQGEGRFYYANGDMYWGRWEKNQMHGDGRYYYASGQRFEGLFLFSKRNGKGKLQRTDGTLDIFQYLNDQRVGQGVRWSADRTKAWRLWQPSTARTGQSGHGGVSALEKKTITVAEAVSLVYEIEQAAASSQEATRVMS